jgi:hypothetical protein
MESQEVQEMPVGICLLLAESSLQSVIMQRREICNRIHALNLTEHVG